MRIEWIEVYMNKAEALISENQVEQGLNILNDLLYEEPGYASLHNHLGWAHLYYTDNLVQAEVHLRAAVQFHPEFAPPYLHLGRLLLRKGQYAEALTRLEAGLLRPEANKPMLFEAIGQVHETRQEYARAIKAYRDATLSSMTGFEINNLTEGIKRCRKKRWMKLMSF